MRIVSVGRPSGDRCCFFLPMEIIIISSVGGPLFLRDQERVFCLYFILMEIIIISSQELTGNLHNPLILVNYQVVKRLIPRPFSANLNHLVPHLTKEFNCGSQLGTLCYVSSLHCYSHVHSNKKAAFHKYQCRPGLWTDNHFLLKIYYCC